MIFLTPNFDPFFVTYSAKKIKKIFQNYFYRSRDRENAENEQAIFFENSTLKSNRTFSSQQNEPGFKYVIGCPILSRHKKNQIDFLS